MKNINFKVIGFGLALIANLAINAYAQPQANDNPAKDIAIKLGIKYMVGVYNSYKFIETTEVWRQYKDSSVKHYKRDINYYFLQFAKDPPEDGFQSVNVSMDTLVYKFTDENESVEFDSRGAKFKPVTFADCIAQSAALGKSFNMIYSPYGEVAKIESEDFNWLREYIETNMKSKDSLKKFNWLDGISNERVKHITNIYKFRTPFYPVKKDSLWKSPFEIQMDGVTFFDSADVKLSDFNGGSNTVSATIKKLTNSSKDAYFYGISQIAQVDSVVSGKGTYFYTLNPNSSIEHAEADFQVDFKGHAANQPFTEKVKSKIFWILLRQYKF